jgi:hypothetical protein
MYLDSSNCRSSNTKCRQDEVTPHSAAHWPHLYKWQLAWISAHLQRLACALVSSRLASEPALLLILMQTYTRESRSTQHSDCCTLESLDTEKAARDTEHDSKLGFWQMLMLSKALSDALGRMNCSALALPKRIANACSASPRLC